MKIKKKKAQKKCDIKRKLKFEDYKTCSEASHIKNKINHLEKFKIDAVSFKEVHKKFIKNNKLILKTQQRFKSERHNFFTKEINKFALSSNDDKRMWSIDLIETYAQGTSKGLACKKEEIRCNSIIKQYKNV